MSTRSRAPRLGRALSALATAAILAVSVAPPARAAAAGKDAARAEEPVDAGPYVPTEQYVVDKMLDMVAPRADDFVIDLGAGDGRIVLTAARRFGARGMGVDIDPELVSQANLAAIKAGLQQKVRFVQQDAFKTDLRDASVLTIYLLPEFVLQLRPKMLAEMRPGSRIVSHDYPFGDWRADREEVFSSPEKYEISGDTQTALYHYVVPARVAGRWQLDLPAGAPLPRVTVDLAQSYQDVTGSVQTDRGPAKLSYARLHGDTLWLGIPVAGGTLHFEGKVDARRVAGAVSGPGAAGAANGSLLAPGRAVGWP